MSTYKVTVNGVSYDVEVQMTGAKEAPVSAPAAQAAPAASAGAAGSVRVEASVAGKIWKL